MDIKETKGTQRAERENSFSKSIMSIMVILYIVGAMIGTILVISAAVTNERQGSPLDPSMFMAYAAYLGGPTATAIIFYAWKSKAENVLKITQSFENEKAVEVIDALSKIN